MYMLEYWCIIGSWQLQYFTNNIVHVGILVYKWKLAATVLSNNITHVRILLYEWKFVATILHQQHCTCWNTGIQVEVYRYNDLPTSLYMLKYWCISVSLQLQHFTNNTVPSCQLQNITYYRLQLCPTICYIISLSVVL